MRETKLTNSKKIKEDTSKKKDGIPSKIEKVSKLQTLCRKELLCEDVGNSSEKPRKQRKYFTVRTSLFIGARGGGGSFKKPPRYDRCEFLQDACPLRRSEGDVFTRIQKFSWKRIVGVNSLPRGASVGEFSKSLTPSKRRARQNS
jgi:hypothetical protein